MTYNAKSIDMLRRFRLDTPAKWQAEIEREEAFLARCKSAELSEPEPGILKLGHMNGYYGVTVYTTDIELSASITDTFSWSKNWNIDKGQDRIAAAKPASAYARKVLENKLRETITEVIADTIQRIAALRAAQ